MKRRGARKPWQHKDGRDGRDGRGGGRRQGFGVLSGVRPTGSSESLVRLCDLLVLRILHRAPGIIKNNLDVKAYHLSNIIHGRVHRNGGTSARPSAVVAKAERRTKDITGHPRPSQATRYTVTPLHAPSGAPWPGPRPRHCRRCPPARATEADRKPQTSQPPQNPEPSARSEGEEQLATCRSEFELPSAGRSVRGSPHAPTVAGANADTDRNGIPSKLNRKSA